MEEYGQEEKQARLTFGDPVVRAPGSQQTDRLLIWVGRLGLSRAPVCPGCGFSGTHVSICEVLPFLTASALSVSWTGLGNKLGLVLCGIQASVFASLACSPKSDVRKAHFFSGNILGDEMALSELLPGTVKGSYCSSYSCYEFNDSLSGKENELSVGKTP